MLPGNKTRLPCVSREKDWSYFINGSMKSCTHKTIHLLILLTLSLPLISGEKGLVKDIPFYIQIDKIKHAVFDGVGTSSQKIPYAWFFQDDEFGDNIKLVHF